MRGSAAKTDKGFFIFVKLPGIAILHINGNRWWSKTIIRAVS